MALTELGASTMRIKEVIPESIKIHFFHTDKNTTTKLAKHI